MFILILILFFIYALPTFLPNIIYADKFLVKNGGKIEGEHINNKEIPHKTHKIKRPDGIEIEIDSDAIARKIPDNPISPTTEYLTFAPILEDNIDNHLKIAEWCRRNNLPELNKLHLNQILEKDPDNETARRLLGYTKNANGIWTTHEQRLLDAGLLRTPKGWMTQQQIEVDKILERRKNAKNYWQKEIKSILNGLPDAHSRKTLLSITDPDAATTIATALAKERNPDIRILLVRTLSNIGTSATIQEIARWAINQTETITSVKRTCFDELRKHKESHPIIIGLYATQLKPQNGVYAINAAANAIAELDGKNAIPQLIDVLITTQTETRLIKPNGGVFDSNSTSLQWGQPKEVKITREVKNVEVLKALCALTGVNFGFDKNAWKNWIIQSRNSQYFNARRCN
jgi:hypothetical protein